MSEYTTLKDTTWDKFGRCLLSEKGSDEQIKFLQACRNGKDDFLDYLNKNLLHEKDAITDGENVTFNHKFIEREFRFPPPNAQKIIWDAFCGIPLENKMSCGFWGNIIINMIKNDCIRPDYLASNLNGVNETGIYILDVAINSNDDNKIDKCVRNILNSMGNKKPRGSARVLFDNFRIGRSYWNWHWAEKLSTHIKYSPAKIYDTIDGIGSYTKFSEKMFSGKSYISQINTLGGLLLFLIHNKKQTELGAIINKIAYLSTWKAIEVQSPELNQQEIEIIADNL